MKIPMSHERAASQITDWYLLHMNVSEHSVKGTARFTLFKKLAQEKQAEILKKIRLKPSEVLVLIMNIAPDRYLINTSARFIYVMKDKQESIYYEELQAFFNYDSFHYQKKKRESAKKRLILTDLGFKKTSGEIIFWKIPDGNMAYHFWDVIRETVMIQTEQELK